MIRHLNALIVVCSIALALLVLGALYFTIRGNFKFAGGSILCAVIAFSMLVILFKERRVARIMNEDNYDKNNTPM